MDFRSVAARAIAAAMVVCASAVRVAAQEADPHAGHQMPPAGHEGHQGHESHEGHDMTAMAREGSGTSWQPDATPMYAFHARRGAWQLMAHENLFVQYLHESGDRGADQGGSINWFMGMAQRPVGQGRVQFNGMISLEPFTIAGCGYPDLLASGERCDGEAIHDRQHPHDLFMELSVRYDAPLAHGLRWQVYGGPAAEPALGPVAFPHRLSAMPNPLAPIAHHWLDATHVAFGVVTGGVYGARWKAEASVFNGREPDEHRTGFDFGALDSVSARVTYLPVRAVALQVSAGRLSEAEAGEGGAARVDLTRVTASATIHRSVGAGGLWASTLAWGRNAETEHASSALLAETSVTLRDRDVWFGRFETAGKTGHDLHLSPETGRFTVAKLQGGYTRYLPPRAGFAAGLGGALSAGFVPGDIRVVYGSRVNLGAAIFVTIRPARAL
jgi:hypothetical protein